MKKKLQNIWIYYKWYLLAAAVVLVLLADFAIEKGKKVEPDYQAAIVTGSAISEESQTRVQQILEVAWDDRNADGQVLVTVHFYQYDAAAMESEDTAVFMASAVQLAADLQLGESVCFFTDYPQLLEEGADLILAGPAEGSCLQPVEELAGFSVLTRKDCVEITKQLFE